MLVGAVVVLVVALWPGRVTAQGGDGRASAELCQFAVQLNEDPDLLIATAARESGMAGWFLPEERRAINTATLGSLLGRGGAELPTLTAADGWVALRAWVRDVRRARVVARDGLGLGASLQLEWCYRNTPPPGGP